MIEFRFRYSKDSIECSKFNSETQELEKVFCEFVGSEYKCYYEYTNGESVMRNVNKMFSNNLCMSFDKEISDIVGTLGSLKRVRRVIESVFEVDKGVIEKVFIERTFDRGSATEELYISGKGVERVVRIKRE